MKNTSLILLALGFVAACKSYKMQAEVQSVSAMKKVMMGTDLSTNLLWDTLKREHLYAVAPLGRLEGEVTVINGEMFLSKVNDKHEVEVENNWAVRSPFAVYSYVDSWNSKQLSVQINSEEDLQKLIENQAKKLGYDLERPFVFRVKGNFEKVDYHIISKPLTEIEHNHDLHHQAKKHFNLQQVEGELIGFYSRHHEGVFTHKGSFIHTHFVNNERSHAGHLENVVIQGRVEILLPK